MYRASFRKFGVAMVRDVFSPEFLQRQLDAALTALLRDTDWLPDVAADITSVHARMPTVLEDTDDERSFAVTVAAVLEAEVGPRLLAVTVDAEVEIDLTVRVRTFRPAVAALDVDPIGTEHLRLDFTAKSDWLPSSLLGTGAGPEQVAEVWDRFAPVLAKTLNEALARSEDQRRVDVLDRVRRWQTAALAPADDERSGDLGRGEALEWPLELGEQERSELHLWAALDPDSPRTRVPVELAVLDETGEPLATTHLEVVHSEPVFDTTADGPGVCVVAPRPAQYRIRLINHGSAAVTFQLRDRRRTVPGEQIDFAVFGENLIRGGVDEITVAAAVAGRLSADAQVVLDGRMLLRGTLATRLLDVRAVESDESERRFALRIELTVELHVGPGSGATVVASTFEARVDLSVSTGIEPATIVVGFEPVRARDLVMVAPPRRVGGRRIPIPERKLAELLPERVLDELNAKLGEARRRIVASELAADAPLRFATPSTALRARTTFEGVLEAGRPRQHTVRLGRGQRIRAKARLFADPDTVDRDVTVQLALCDDRGGVWANDEQVVPADGTAKVVGVEFTAPQAGQWRLRLTALEGAGEMDYELQIRPDS